MRTIWHNGNGVGYEKAGMVGWNDPRYGVWDRTCPAFAISASAFRIRAFT
jgi:hypothetical protein